MTNTIKIKRNITNTDAPTTSDFERGELAFVESTQKLFYRDNSDNIRVVGGDGSFLRSDGNDTVNGNLSITGNLTVQGTTTQVDSTVVTITDPFIKLAKDNDANDVDIGFYGAYKEGSTNKFAGLARDANDSGKFILFDGLQVEPNSTVNTSGTGFNKQTLKANIEGNLSGTPTITSPIISGSLDLNGVELILDEDADTSITASTDDQIDFKVGGFDELILTTSTLRPNSNNGLNLGNSTTRFATVYGTTGNFTSVSTTNFAATSQIESSLATGTSPFSVSSTTVNTNLNADLLDGQHAPSGDIVGTSDTQTLTNKSLTSANLTTPNIVESNSGKILSIATTNVAANRTLTIPGLTGNDTFVFAAQAQTLTNKVIDGGTF